MTQGKDDANARLRAAAPELLAALEQVVERLDADSPVGGWAAAVADVITIAEHAIAKAEGRPMDLPTCLTMMHAPWIEIDGRAVPWHVPEEGLLGWLIDVPDPEFPEIERIQCVRGADA